MHSKVRLYTVWPDECFDEASSGEGGSRSVAESCSSLTGVVVVVEVVRGVLNTLDQLNIVVMHIFRCTTVHAASCKSVIKDC